MSTQISTNGQILTAQGILAGQLHFAQKIRALKKSKNTKSAATSLILPGHIDLHVHGAGGRDFMQGDDALRVIATTHARHGTTALLATTVTSHPETLLRAFRDAARCLIEMQKNKTPAAAVLGIHLEGPYINEKKLGAQPSDVRPFDLAEIKKLHAIVPIRVITLAPEMLPGPEALKELARLKIVVQLGHSDASYEEAAEILENGRHSVTHLFNAMSAFHHRAPGLAGAALAHATYAELIPDLQHVHAGAIRAALRAIPKLYFVTDATAATAMPDGQFQLGTHTVTKCQGGVRLPDGTLAGSCLTMHQAFRHARQLGLSVDEASRRTSTYAAELLRLKGRGELKVGAFADVVVLNRKGDLQQVFCQGRALL